MSKDLEAWLSGGYILGGMVFIVWFLHYDTPAFQLLVSLARRPFRAVMFLVIFVYWILWPITLIGFGLWTIVLKERHRADP